MVEGGVLSQVILETPRGVGWFKGKTGWLPLSNKKQKGLYSYLKYNDDFLMLFPPDLILF